MKPSLLVIGLGNPGKQYDRTRHNAGFLGLNVLSTAYGQGEWKDQQKFLAFTQEARVVTVPVLFVKPTTYMNRSGESVRKLVDFYKLNPAEQVLVLTDDIDLPLGTLRLRHRGSAGTHNGLKSIVEQYGEDFPRLKIGIGPKSDVQDLATWVLSRFSDEEQRLVEGAVATLPQILSNFVMGQLPTEA